MRLISRVASSEWPPSSKKLSSMPTRSTPQHLGKQRAQDLLLRRARRAPYAVGRQARAPAAPGGRACRSASAAAVQHHERRRHHVVRQARRSMRPQRRRIGTLAPPPPPHRRPAACRRAAPRARSPPPAPPPACRVSAASISPGSMRKPRSFTCASARPRNSSTPSARQRARSPVRYIRLPGRPERVGHEPLRRQPRPAQIAARQTRARDVQLARHPDRHRLQARVQHIDPRVPDRTADRDVGPASVASSTA